MTEKQKKATSPVCRLYLIEPVSVESRGRKMQLRYLAPASRLRGVFLATTKRWDNYLTCTLALPIRGALPILCVVFFFAGGWLFSFGAKAFFHRKPPHPPLLYEAC